MKKYKFISIVLIFSVFFISSCDMTNQHIAEDEPQHSIQTYTISGNIQKGPYVQGTEITIRELDPTLYQTGKTLTGTIDDNSGAFSIRGDLESKYVEISALGYYFNEVTGNLSESQLRLQGITKLDETNTIVNLNVLTHLEKKRLEYLVDQGSQFEDAKKQAQREVFAVFKIDSTDFESSEVLSIAESGEGNAALLAVSAILLAGRSEAEITELLSNISTDIRTDGMIDSNSIIAELESSTNFLKDKYDEIQSNLENRYEKMGVSINIPNFKPFLFGLDVTPPAVKSFEPFSNYNTYMNYGGRSLIKDRFRITFSEIIDPNSISDTSIYFQNNNGTVASVGIRPTTIAPGGGIERAELTIADDAILGGDCALHFTEELKDIAGNSMTHYVYELNYPKVAEAINVPSSWDEFSSAEDYDSEGVINDGNVYYAFPYIPSQSFTATHLYIGMYFLPRILYIYSDNEGSPGDILSTYVAIDQMGSYPPGPDHASPINQFDNLIGIDNISEYTGIYSHDGVSLRDGFDFEKGKRYWLGAYGAVGSRGVTTTTWPFSTHKYSTNGLDWVNLDRDTYTQIIILSD